MTQCAHGAVDAISRIGTRLTAVLADARAAYQSGNIGAAKQAVEATAAAGEAKVRRLVARAAISAVAGTAVRAAIVPIAMPGAGGAAIAATAAALPARRADAGAPRRAGVVGAADEAAAARMVGPRRAAAAFVAAVMRRCASLPAQNAGEGRGCAGKPQVAQRPAPRRRSGQNTSQGIESLIVQVRPRWP
jgi:hypothetical protein